MGEWRGQPAWLIRFRQRADRPTSRLHGFEAPDGARPYRGQGLRIPTLAEVLAWLPEGMGLVAEIKAREALDEIVAGVKRIPVELAAARDKLWTPEKEKEGTKMNIWTPGSEEAR